MVQNYAAIGVLEELGAFERQLMHMFPQWFDVSKASAVNDRERANQNKNNKKKSPEMMRRVRAANNYDTLLYQVALELFHKRAIHSVEVGSPSRRSHRIERMAAA